MMNLILPILSYFLGNAKNLFKEPSIALTQQLAMHIRSFILLIVTCVGSLTLFCVGTSLLISRISSQFDSREGFYFSVGMGIYTAMAVLSLGVLVYCLRRKTWLNAMGFNQPPAKQASSRGGAIENAVALLVMDFIEERQNRRQQSQDSASDHKHTTR